MKLKIFGLNEGIQLLSYCWEKKSLMDGKKEVKTQNTYKFRDYAESCSPGFQIIMMYFQFKNCFLLQSSIR